MPKPFQLSATTQRSARELYDTLSDRPIWEVSECSARYLPRETSTRATCSWANSDEGLEVRFQCHIGGPDIHGREYEQEWRALADAWACTWDSPDSDDFDDLSDAWREANAAAIEESVDSLCIIDRDARQKTWEWNRGRNDIQSLTDGDVLVPRIFFFTDVEEDGDSPQRARRGVIWPDGVPMLLPDVELLAVSIPSTDRLEATPGLVVIDFDRSVELIDRYSDGAIESRDEPQHHLVCLWESAPYELLDELAADADSDTADRWEGQSGRQVVESDLLPD